MGWDVWPLGAGWRAVGWGPWSGLLQVWDTMGWEEELVNPGLGGRVSELGGM